MLFKGTEKLGPGDYDQIVEAAGGYLNAATSMDFTNYYVSVPSKNFAQVFPAFADAMSHSAIAPAEVESERKVILEEIRRKNDSPFGFLFDQSYPRLYRSGAYTHPVIGYAESVASLSPEQLREHYERHYTAESMALAVAGDLTWDEAAEAVEREFSDLRTHVRPWDDLAEQRPAEPADQQFSTSWRESYFIFAAPLPAFQDLQTMAAANLAELLLAAGRNSRLVKSLQEEQKIVRTIGASIFETRQSGPFLVYGTADGEKLETIRAAISAELDRLASAAPEEGELRRVKKMARNAQVFGQERRSSVASEMGNSWVLRGDLSLVEDFPEILESIEGEQIRQFAEQWLRPERCSYFRTVFQN